MVSGVCAIGYRDFVGADAHIGPLGTIEFVAGYRVSAISSARGDVGIAPYDAG